MFGPLGLLGARNYDVRGCWLLNSLTPPVELVFTKTALSAYRPVHPALPAYALGLTPSSRTIVFTPLPISTDPSPNLPNFLRDKREGSYLNGNIPTVFNILIARSMF